MSGAEKDAPDKSVQDFLQRWSRRKLGAAEAEDATVAATPAKQSPQTGESQPTAPSPAEPAAKPSPAEAAVEPPPAFDPASLPPIESIDATTDIRAFLAPGVPVELTRAALRRAWTSDPAIRDFVGIAENQWDFTNPDAVPGFGSLPFTDEVRAMVSRLFGETPAQASHESGDESCEAADASGDAEAKSDRKNLSLYASVPPNTSGSDHVVQHAAMQNEADTQEKRQLGPPKHGTALPK